MAKYRNLTLKDRQKIEKMYSDNIRPDAIAEEVGVCRATIYHELKKGSTGELDHNGRYGYSAELGQKFAAEAAHRKGRARTAETVAEA